MVHPRPSCKGSCFFPIIGKAHHAKNSTHIIDETQTEVITLQMRNSSDEATLKNNHTSQRQVIGVLESCETCVLAEYTGSLWSLLDSKWSLKQMKASTADDLVI